VEIALDLDSSARAVEQAQLDSDQLAAATVAHDFDCESAAGLTDQRGDRDTQGVINSPGRDFDPDRGS
jgi:hypothetical protein